MDESRVAKAKDREQIDLLAEEFLERYRSGQRPAITEYVSKHPDLAGEIRDLFPTLAALERLGPRPDELTSRPIDAALGGAIPRQLGEYQLLREVGRGGMGIVYEAEQLSLGRRVALKVLPSHSVLPSSLLTRFQNEARAAARLHHTNIVPVFGVGEDQGIHYYAMQFIQGQGLDAVLDELRSLRRIDPPRDPAANEALAKPPAQPLSRVIAKDLLTGQFDAESPTAEQPIACNDPSSAADKSAGSDLSNHSSSDSAYFRSVARMGYQVADALAHAHGQGVLHRDIKPSNLLLDALGCVWVTDFGLAKQEGSDLTKSGDVVGTLRYLAPERFRGTSDARTDIYGLGVTLYELLTISPAFGATDRARLVHDIVEIDPVPPRRLSPQIPRDLETIVLKAMAKEPARRYATATEMAADLRRFLDDQPIGARRTWMAERVWRWCVRRPALAGLAFALLISLVGGLCGVLWQWDRAETNLKEAVRQQGLAETSLSVARLETARAEQNLQEAARQRTAAEREAQRAEENYKVARQAVDELLTMVSEDDLMNQPGLQPLRIRLLTRALEYYQGMLATRADDPKARTDLAASYFRVALIKRLTGPSDEAVENYRKAIDLLEQAIADRPDDREAGIMLVKSYNEKALLKIDDHAVAEAQRELDRARQLASQIATALPDSVSAQTTLAMTLNNVAWCLSRSPGGARGSRLDEVLQIHQQALDTYRQIAAKHPGDYIAERGISNTLSNMGRRNYDARRFDEAQRLFEDCLKIRRALAERKPDWLEMKWLVAATYNALGDWVLRAPQMTPDAFEQGLTNYNKSLEIQERLLRENPAVVYLRHQTYGTLSNLADLYARNNDSERALEMRRRANDVLQPCLAQDGAGLLYHLDWTASQRAQAELEDKRGHATEAIAARLKVREAWRVIQEHPAVFEPHRDQAIRNLTLLMLALGYQSRLAEIHSIALEQQELRANRPAQLLSLSWELERSIRAAARGATLTSEEAQTAERCLDLAIAAFQESAAGAPDQVKPFIRQHASMAYYETLMKHDEALKKDSENADELFHRGTVLSQLGYSRRAEEDWARATGILNARLQQSPTDLAALRQRTLLHFAAHRWPETMADATLLLKNRSKDTTILRRRAEAAGHLGNWQQAQEDYGRVLALSPKDAFCLHQRARASLESGQPEEAARDMRRLRQLVGQDAAVAGTSAWRFVDHHDAPRFPEDALWCAQRAIDLDPRLDRPIALGGIYCQLGRDQEAIDTLTTALREATGTASALGQFWLAISLHRLGQAEKAQEAYRRAIRIWKSPGLIAPTRQELLERVWHEAKAGSAGGNVGRDVAQTGNHFIHRHHIAQIEIDVEQIHLVE